MSMQNKVLEKIFSYENYRIFLKDYFHEQKKIKNNFSLRAFVKKAGFGSASYSSYIIEGKRNLTANSTAKMIKGLGIKGKKAKFFELLVFYTQAKTVEEKEKYFSQLQNVRKTTNIYKINKNQISLYDNWYNIVIRELATNSNWGNDFSKLANMVTPKITASEAKKSILLLEKIGLIKKDINNKYFNTDEIISAANIPELYIKKYRREMIYKASEAADTLTKEERNVSGVTISLSKEGFDEVSNLVDEFRAKLLAIATNEQKKEKVYQVNIQAFPLGNIEKK